MKQQIKHSLFFLWGLLLLTAMPLTVQAKIRLPQPVSDRMVLQRDVELKIWGWADAGEKVTVRFRGRHYFTEADKAGNWHVMLPAQAAGGPFIMEVNERIIRDVLVGDVWLMSGQSNQENPIHRLVEKFPEIETTNNHMIRHYKVPTANTPMELQEDIAVGNAWTSATSSDVLRWTSLAFFFASETYRHTGVPVGVIVSSLGGSDIKSWVSQEHLKSATDPAQYAELKGLPASLQSTSMIKPEGVANYVIDREAYDALQTVKTDRGETEGWQRPETDDRDWADISLPSTWAEKGIKTKGAIWYRKHFTCPESMVGRHARIYMGRMQDDDRVYVNGVLVGHTAYFGPPRKYDIPAGVLREGDNVVTLRLEAKNGWGEVVPDKPYKIQGDEDVVSLEGEWKYRVGYDLREAAPYEARLKNLPQVGSGLYNGMIYPLRHWKVRGAVWYQGETNAGKPQEYYPMLRGLIENWRELWQQPELPFMLVQLPNYMQQRAQPTDSGWARLREAQLTALYTIPHTSLATTYDVGEWNDIHPLDKKSVAQRLFLGARRLTFGEKVVSEGPVYKSMKVEKDRIVLEFETRGRGLKVRTVEATSPHKNLLPDTDSALKHFAIAGTDKKFVWAKAEIRGNKVIVSSPEVPEPVAVRYAWSDNPVEANLVNKDGLPASPFRTDDW